MYHSLSTCLLKDILVALRFWPLGMELLYIHMQVFVWICFQVILFYIHILPLKGMIRYFEAVLHHTIIIHSFLYLYIKPRVDYLASLWKNKQRGLNKEDGAPRRGRARALDGEAGNREGGVTTGELLFTLTNSSLGVVPLLSLTILTLSSSENPSIMLLHDFIFNLFNFFYFICS